MAECAHLRPVHVSGADPVLARAELGFTVFASCEEFLVSETSVEAEDVLLALSECGQLSCFGFLCPFCVVELFERGSGAVAVELHEEDDVVL